MLTLGQALLGKKILSLRTGGQLGELLEPIINPNNLKIEGWFINDRFHKRKSILLSKEIRDILPQGVVVNDHEALSEPAELVRLKKVLDVGFELIGKKVVTTSKSRLGKVNDYAFEKNAFFIQKLYIAKSILKSIGTTSNVVDRTQIVEITHSRIVVKDATVSLAEEAQAPAAAVAQ
jgi:uncharacterized protein YrrD